MNDPFANVRCKPDLHRLFTQLGYKTGVEVGVLRGIGSEMILRESEIDRLYSIDFWNHEDKSDLFNFEDYLHAISRLFKYEERSVVINMDAVEASNLFPDGSLCFVYIDAGLTYELYMQQLETWWPKIKEGGVLAGHIFEWIFYNGEHLETDAPFLASEHFAEKYGLDKKIVIDRPIPPHADPNSFKGSRSWMVMKPPAEVVSSA